MTTATATLDPPAQLTFRDVLRIVVMRRVWYAQMISLFGDFLALYAVIAVVSFKLNATANQVTGVQIAYMVPFVFMGPLAGVFVDRWPLKPTLIASDLTRAMLAMLLIFATSLWQIYFVLAALSCVSAFFGPAQGVTIRSHVPLNGLIAANGLMQIAFMGSRVVGPGAAGAVVYAAGPDTCYILDVVSFVLSASLIASVAIRRPDDAKKPTESSSNRIHAIWIDMKVGANFIVHHAAILFVVLAMAAGLFTIGCFGPLISIFVRDTLHESARAFGIVSGMVGLGMLIGTQLVRRFAEKTSNETLVLSGLAGIGASVFLLGAVPHLAATMASTFGLGFAFAAIIVPSQTLIQRETPPELLGRVGSTNTSIVFFGQILGLFASGVLAEAIGVHFVFFLCAGLALALVGAGRLFLHAKS